MKVCILGPTQSQFSPNSLEFWADILYAYEKERQAVLVQTLKGHLLTSEARVHVRLMVDEVALEQGFLHLKGNYIGT
jgi:hypothetical protein